MCWFLKVSMYPGCLPIRMSTYASALQFHAVGTLGYRVDHVPLICTVSPDVLVFTIPLSSVKVTNLSGNFHPEGVTLLRNMATQSSFVSASTITDAKLRVLPVNGDVCEVVSSATRLLCTMPSTS
jgi:hypothetical protein